MRTTILRGGRVSSRPFYTTVLLLSLLAAYSFLAQTHRPRSPLRDGLLLKRDDAPDCSEVHNVADQCAFVTQYCLDEDAGLLPYLNLYYCVLGEVQPVAFVLLVALLGLLFTTIGIAASDFFSVNLGTIATILGLSESLAGVTFLAFGNGSPDVFSTFAAMGSNSASMAVGELIGAACFISGVVAGSMALVREFKVDRRTYARDICFFIVAVAFTMVFLADGHLRFWECCAMIGYYAVYVITVVLWHWYTKRRSQRLRREGEARSHVYGVVGHAVDELAGEPYRDDPDEAERDRAASAAPSGVDISALESGPRIEIGDRGVDAEDDDTYGEHDRLVAAEVASSMRVLRSRGKRSSTMAPIRPSLVGALEFRSALAQLQRESNLRLSHIPGRSYPGRIVGGSGRARSSSALYDPTQRDRHTIAGPHELPHRRDRALSSGDMPVSSPLQEDLLAAARDHSHQSLGLPEQTAADHTTRSQSPSYTVGGSLAPPLLRPLGTATASPVVESPGKVDMQPQLFLDIPSRRSSQSGRSSPSSPFPRYTDSPVTATPHAHAQSGEYIASRRRDSTFADLQASTEEPRPVRWWPYAVLPPPHILLATLFPTLQGWREKTHWDRFISAISVPSIFLLVTTLPVVESETTAGSSLAETFVDIPISPGFSTHHAPAVSTEPQAIEPESEWQRYRRRTLTRNNSYSSSRNALLSMENEDTLVDAPQVVPTLALSDVAAKPDSDIRSTFSNANESAGWNRWLVCLQLFTGPQFAMFILWANISGDWEEPGKALVRMVLYTLVASLVLLAVLVLFTSEQKRPKYHALLCFMGFVISIAWISTIAGEVVGVLKAFGVILGISEALLGLTIFAAGNSVGDLVADITVARLGYPVMALSACFGGPMLNILLGIGIGGVFMMVEKANHEHSLHPDQPYKYGTYRVEVGGTLMISAITLLVMLLGLLVAVPMNKWILSRKIGWVLIGLWTLSTVVNVVVEVTGVWKEVA